MAMTKLDEIPFTPIKTTLFQQKENGETYRIPALISFREETCGLETYLAFAEKRTASKDEDAKLLVMRRGICKNENIEWSPLEELERASLPGHRTMNPCPVYESYSNTLFLFFICVKDGVTEQQQIKNCKNAARLCYISSNDKGQSWNQKEGPIDIGEKFKEIDEKMKKDWATFAVGPGHGIQMKSGRLIIPAYAYKIPTYCCCSFCCCCCCCVKPYAFSFYSDDQGETWHVGELIDKETCECQMAEIVNHEGISQLYCNARNTKDYRVEALSKNEGASFEKANLVPKLVEDRNGCQGSVISFPKPLSEDEDGVQKDGQSSARWLLYSHPTNNRADMGVYLNKSPLDPSEWEEPWIIYHGPSGYSDLTHHEGTEQFACLMECGDENYYEKIVFMVFCLTDVKQ
ncbi:sialidase-3-like [Megalops cyprinoides]|uniref:sialidase-3-like n=1 Tax=Megalops cyprinoides TaxID=118141 RepID=UPI0018649C15|nr:sialidase-3-like [Megalops cyprinoides]